MGSPGGTPGSRALLPRKEAVQAGHQHVNDGEGHGLLPGRRGGAPSPGVIRRGLWTLEVLRGTCLWVLDEDSPLAVVWALQAKPPAGVGAAPSGASFSPGAGAGVYAELCGLRSLPLGGCQAVSRYLHKPDPSSAPGETQAVRCEVQGCVWLLPNPQAFCAARPRAEWVWKGPGGVVGVGGGLRASERAGTRRLAPHIPAASLRFLLLWALEEHLALMAKSKREESSNQP